MSNQPTPYDAASTADPETHPWGFFSVDPWAGGAGVLLWFESPEQLLAGVREGEPALYLSDADAVATLQGNVDQLLTRLAQGEDAYAVLAELDDTCEGCVVWFGQLDDLLESDGEWAVERRVEFRDPDVDAGDPKADASPITADERAEFVDYIRAYVLA
jgi:hypothetical protein